MIKPLQQRIVKNEHYEQKNLSSPYKKKLNHLSNSKNDQTFKDIEDKYNKVLTEMQRFKQKLQEKDMQTQNIIHEFKNYLKFKKQKFVLEYSIKENQINFKIYQDKDYEFDFKIISKMKDILKSQIEIKTEKLNNINKKNSKVRRQKFKQLKDLKDLKLLIQQYGYFCYQNKNQQGKTQNQKILQLTQNLKIINNLSQQQDYKSFIYFGIVSNILIKYEIFYKELNLLQNSIQQFDINKVCELRCQMTKLKNNFLRKQNEINYYNVEKYCLNLYNIQLLYKQKNKSNDLTEFQQEYRLQKIQDNQEIKSFLYQKQKYYEKQILKVNEIWKHLFKQRSTFLKQLSQSPKDIVRTLFRYLKILQLNKKLKMRNNHQSEISQIDLAQILDKIQHLDYQYDSYCSQFSKDLQKFEQIIKDINRYKQDNYIDFEQIQMIIILILRLKSTLSIQNIGKFNKHNYEILQRLYAYFDNKSNDTNDKQVPERNIKILYNNLFSMLIAQLQNKSVIIDKKSLAKYKQKIYQVVTDIYKNQNNIYSQIKKFFGDNLQLNNFQNKFNKIQANLKHTANKILQNQEQRQSQFRRNNFIKEFQESIFKNRKCQNQGQILVMNTLCEAEYLFQRRLFKHSFQQIHKIIQKQQYSQYLQQIALQQRIKSLKLYKIISNNNMLVEDKQKNLKQLRALLRQKYSHWISEDAIDRFYDLFMKKKRKKIQRQLKQTYNEWNIILQIQDIKIYKWSSKKDQKYRFQIAKKNTKFQQIKNMFQKFQQSNIPGLARVISFENSKDKRHLIIQVRSRFNDLSEKGLKNNFDSKLEMDYLHQSFKCEKQDTNKIRILRNSSFSLICLNQVIKDNNLPLYPTIDMIKLNQQSYSLMPYMQFISQFNSSQPIARNPYLQLYKILKQIGQKILNKVNLQKFTYQRLVFNQLLNFIKDKAHNTLSLNTPIDLKRIPFFFKIYQIKNFFCYIYESVYGSIAKNKNGKNQLYKKKVLQNILIKTVKKQKIDDKYDWFKKDQQLYKLIIQGEKQYRKAHQMPPLQKKHIDCQSFIKGMRSLFIHQLNSLGIILMLRSFPSLIPDLYAYYRIFTNQDNAYDESMKNNSQWLKKYLENDQISSIIDKIKTSTQNDINEYNKLFKDKYLVDFAKQNPQILKDIKTPFHIIDALVFIGSKNCSAIKSTAKSFWENIEFQFNGLIQSLNIIRYQFSQQKI